MSITPPPPAEKGYWGFVGTDGNVEDIALFYG